MKQREQGQGLVEYALILVLVAVVVIAILGLLGPPIGCTFDRVIHGFWGPTVPETTTACMQRNTPTVIDFFADGQNMGFDRTTLEITRAPSNGMAVVERDEDGVATGKALYTPATDFSGEDVFKIRLCLFGGTCGTAQQRVIVWGDTGASSMADSDLAAVLAFDPDISAGADRPAAAADAEQQPDNWDAVYEQTWIYRQLRSQQVNGMLVGRLAAKDAFDGMTQIISDHAASSGNAVLLDGVASLIQAVEAGDEAAVTAAMSAIATDLAQVPSDIQTAVLAEAGPHLVDAYQGLLGTVVPEATFEATVQVWMAQEENNPGSTADTIQRLYASWADIAAGNQVIEQIQPALEDGTFVVIGVLANSGDEAYVDLAHRLGDAFYWGNVEEAIDKALVANRGIETSMRAKLQAAQSAYERGDLMESGTVLSELLTFVDAKDGKQIDPDSAALIRSTVLGLAEGLGIALPDSGAEQ